MTSSNRASANYRRGSVSDEVEEQGAGGLEQEKARRLAALDAMRSKGDNPYPYRFDRSHSLADIRAEHTELEPGSETESHVSVAGRIMLKRDQGKLIFATLQDRTDAVQLFISKAVVGDELFDYINDLDLGDWVGATGSDDHTQR